MTLLQHPEHPGFDQAWQKALESAKKHPRFIEAELWNDHGSAVHSTWRWLQPDDHSNHFQSDPCCQALPTLSTSSPMECVDKVNAQRSAGFNSEFQNGIVEKLFVKEHPAQQRIFMSLAMAGLPSIQISPFEGQILELLLRSIRAQRGVEIGVLGGYSASWISRALGSTGELWALDRNPQALKLASLNLEPLPGRPKIHWMEGKASESLEKLSHLSGLDFVFMDADKAGTPAYLQWAIPRLRSGGMVIVDNAYAWGAMSYLGSSDLGPSGPPTSVPPKGRFDHWSLKDFEAMSLSWRILAESPELHSVVIPTGEGMAVGLKLR